MHFNKTFFSLHLRLLGGFNSVSYYFNVNPTLTEAEIKQKKKAYHKNYL
jgi:hypothetical protein